MDYSFSGVNLDTVSFAPKESMQFGRALQRVMSSIVLSDPRYDAVYLSKIDIANGVYRVWLQTWDTSKLGMVLPTAPGEEPLEAFPLALPMGRVESPPYFTAITETARDLANSNLRRTPRLPVQRLELPQHLYRTQVVSPHATAQPPKSVQRSVTRVARRLRPSRCMSTISCCLPRRSRKRSAYCAKPCMPLIQCCALSRRRIHPNAWNRHP